MTGTLAGILKEARMPKIYVGGNCSREEWEDSLREGVEWLLLDEQEYGRRSDYWGDLCHRFPQLTLRDFVQICGQVVLPPNPNTGR